MAYGFTFKLEHENCRPADPPTFQTAVPNWKAGVVIPLGHGSLRVVGLAMTTRTLVVGPARQARPTRGSRRRRPALEARHREDGGRRGRRGSRAHAIISANEFPDCGKPFIGLIAPFAVAGTLEHDETGSGDRRSLFSAFGIGVCLLDNLEVEAIPDLEVLRRLSHDLVVAGDARPSLDV